VIKIWCFNHSDPGSAPSLGTNIQHVTAKQNKTKKPTKSGISLALFFQIYLSPTALLHVYPGVAEITYLFL